MLLNIADMMVDSHGNTVGFNARLDDVRERYGEDSPQYEQCSRMVDLLRNTEEYWRITGEPDDYYRGKK